MKIEQKIKNIINKFADSDSTKVSEGIKKIISLFDAYKCCGNCLHMDIIVDNGGVCCFGSKYTPCDRDGWYDDWELNK